MIAAVEINIVGSPCNRVIWRAQRKRKDSVTRALTIRNPLLLSGIVYQFNANIVGAPMGLACAAQAPITLAREVCSRWT